MAIVPATDWTPRRVTVINQALGFLEMMDDFLSGERFAASLIDCDDISSHEPI